MDGYVLPPTYPYEYDKCRLTHPNFGQDQHPEDTKINAEETLTDRGIKRLPEEEYAEHVMKFLSEFSWIYDFQLTHLLTGQTLSCIPKEWSHYLESLSFHELNELPTNPNMVGAPSSLGDFIRTCQELSLPREVHDNITPVQLSQSVTKGMNPKKRHEVSKMAAVVTDLSLRSNCPLVVDVGAGLGYLSAVIARHSKLRVLALECREMLTHGTEARGLDQGLAENLDALTYNLQDNEDNFQNLRTVLLEKLQSCARSFDCFDTQDYGAGTQGWANQESSHLNSQEYIDISDDTCPLENHTPQTYPNAQQTGYSTSCFDNNTHECIGNSPEVVVAGTSEISLASSTKREPGKRTTDMTTNSTPALSNHALHNPGICMIGLHCCGSLTPTMMKLFTSTPEIHSMVCVSCCYHSLQQTGVNKWAHFPMSQVVKNMMESKFPNFNISVFGMRLAAQETRARWASQTESDHNFHRNNVGFRALLQLVCQQEGVSIEKEKRHLANKKDMVSLDNYISAVLQRSNLGKDYPELGNKLYEAYTEHSEKFDLIEPFTGLQVAMQPVLESLVLVDRILYLREAGTESTLVPIFKDSISPRNIAIVAVKGNFSGKLTDSVGL